MELGNVLVIGNSGVGKSTLINAVLGESTSVTITRELLVKEPLPSKSDYIPFRMIDTVGFEPSLFKTRQSIRSVKRWSENAVKEGREDAQINVIWFCVDGTSRRLFSETIKNLTRATSLWTSVPIIVVITKSYSVPERTENRQMVYDAFKAQKRFSRNLRGILPVVADTFVLNTEAFAPPEGIEELVELTNSLLPEGVRAAKDDIEAYKLTQKRTLAHSIVGASTAGAVMVGALPVPIPDAMILVPTEMAMLNAITFVYDLKKDKNSNEFLKSMVSAGTVSLTAKTALAALKAIPGLNIGVSVLNAVIAGSMVAALGEVSIFVLEQVRSGKKTMEDIEWVTKVVESKLSNQFVEKVAELIKTATDQSDKKTIVAAVLELFTTSSK